MQREDKLFRHRIFHLFILWGVGFGHMVAQAQKPTPMALPKIVSLSPVVSEWTAEILGEKKALAEIVGISEYSNYPAYLEKITTVGPYPQIQIEKIAALKPTLVLASAEYNLPEQIEKLKRLHLNVVVLKAEHFSTMKDWIRELGIALQEEQGGQRASAVWEIGIKTLKKTKAHRMFLQIQEEPLISIGGTGFLNEAFASIGYQNVFSSLSQAYPKISREAVLKENPDTIFILAMGTNTVEADKGAKAATEHWEIFKDLEAVKKKQIRALPADDFARCSLRLLHALGELK